MDINMMRQTCQDCERSLELNKKTNQGFTSVLDQLIEKNSQLDIEIKNLKLMQGNYLVELSNIQNKVNF